MDGYFRIDIPQPRKCPFGIFVDQIGYYPDGIKRAVLTAPNGSFRVETQQGECRYEGTVTHFGEDTLSGDDVYIADFSGFAEKGRFRVVSGELCSAFFDINENVYEKVFDDILKAFYYLRCGCSLDERYAGRYSHGACHDRPAVLYEDRSVSLDVTGGWHDAGDYGKYTTTAACALAHMLYAYRLFPKAFGRKRADVPESDMPYILSECRSELEWLLKMQREDGAVWHKVSTMKHAAFIMPEEDRDQLYVFPASSYAAADFAAVCALASGIYGRYDAEFSGRLRTAAERSYSWLEENPELLGFENPPECNTGDYHEKDDISNRFWAGAELYALTGEERYHVYLKKFAEKISYFTGFGYTEMSGLGALAYLLSDREKESALAEKFRDAFIGEAGWWHKPFADASGYAVSMRDYDFHWGSNLSALRHAIVYAVSDHLLGESRFREYAAAQLHYLFGANPTGHSFVTGCGEFCCTYPHFRPAVADGVDECIPGFVCGGPNRDLSDETARSLIPEGTPPMKCYIDDVRCYSLNEVAIYWNSPAVFVLAYFNNAD